MVLSTLQCKNQGFFLKNLFASQVARVGVEAKLIWLFVDKNIVMYVTMLQ